MVSDVRVCRPGPPCCHTGSSFLNYYQLLLCEEMGGCMFTVCICGLCYIVLCFPLHRESTKRHTCLQVYRPMRGEKDSVIRYDATGRTPGQPSHNYDLQPLHNISLCRLDMYQQPVVYTLCEKFSSIVYSCHLKYTYN